LFWIMTNEALGELSWALSDPSSSCWSVSCGGNALIEGLGIHVDVPQLSDGLFKGALAQDHDKRRRPKVK